MWRCATCDEAIGDNFSACWRCGSSKDGTPDPHFRGVEASPVLPESDVGAGPISCPRCLCALQFVGTKSFHEGTRWGALGDIGELFVKKEKFDVYCCPRCGRVEFFVDGIGEEFRPH